jgi:hypothetical protein
MPGGLVLLCGLIAPAENAVVSKECVVAANGRYVLVLLYAYATPHATPRTRAAPPTSDNNVGFALSQFLNVIV